MSSIRRLRALPDDPALGGEGGNADGIVALPSEAALTTWVAHRSHRALDPLFAKLAEVSGGAMSVASMWHIVGGAVVSAATQVPLLAGSSELTSMRRGQAVLDALVGFGLPVRGTTRMTAREGLAKLGQPCLCSSYEDETTGPRRSPEGCRDSRSTRRTGPAQCVGPVRISGFVDGSAAVGPVIEGAEVVDLGVAHFLEGLPGQRRGPPEAQ